MSAFIDPLQDMVLNRAQRSPLAMAVLGPYIRNRQKQQGPSPNLQMSHQVATTDGTVPAPPPAATSTPTQTTAPVQQPPGVWGSPETDDAADDSGIWGSAEPMGAGKVVDKPTLAMLGDKGPEAVVPLTDQPGAKVPPTMLGAGGIRTRSRHVTGPNALGRQMPVRADLPLKQNVAVR